MVIYIERGATCTITSLMRGIYLNAPKKSTVLDHSLLLPGLIILGSGKSWLKFEVFMDGFNRFRFSILKDIVF